MARKLIALRVDPTVATEFRKLIENEDLGLGYAVQRLMEATVTCGSVGNLASLARMGNPRLARADRHRVKAAMVALSGEFRGGLAEWLKGEYVDREEIQDALEELQALIPLVDDATLLTKAECLIAESLIFLKASEIEDTKVRRRFLAEAERILGAVSPGLRNALLTGPEKEE